MGKKVKMQTQAITKITANRGSKAPQIVAIAQQHPDLTTTEIGKMVGCNHSNVVNTLKRYGIQKASTDDYIANRAQVFAGLQERILKSITDEDIKKTPAIQKVTAASILYDKERLERGQSTDNIGVIGKLIHEIKGMESDE